MGRLGLLFSLMMFASACSQADAASWRTKRRSNPAAKRGGCAPDVFARYSDWAFTFDGTNFATATWPQASGSDADIEMSQQHGAMVDGQATGLPTCAVGVDRVNDAVLFDEDCYDEQEGVAAIGPDIHIRMLIDNDGAINGDSIWHLVQGSDKIRFQFTGQTTLRARSRHGYGSDFLCDVTVPNAGYWLGDYFIDADGGSGGVETATFCINGTCTDCGDAAGAGTGMSADSSIYMGHSDGCASSTLNDTTVAFIGLRNTISDISESEHDTDVARLEL